MNALTPGHFLIGETINSVPNQVYSNSINLGGPDGQFFNGLLNNSGSICTSASINCKIASSFS